MSRVTRQNCHTKGVNDVQRWRKARKPLPSTLVGDNGPEFTSKAMFFWGRDRRVKLHFIQSGKPTQYAFVESFNGKFRDYCLNLHWFASLEVA